MTRKTSRTATEIDEKKGLVKTDWAGIRQRIKKVDPIFAELVDELAPDKTFPVFLAYYPYGSIITNTETVYIPTHDGSSYSLLEPSIPSDVIKHLGYGKKSAPFSMVLEKTMEWFVDLKAEQVSLPRVAMYYPGRIFPISRLLSKNCRVFSPNGVLSCTAGARSVFMLPHISSTINHLNLQRDFKVQSSAPKSLYEHWNIFKEIANNDIVSCDWRCCVALFSEKWQESIQNDPAWYKLKMYIIENAWSNSEYERHRHYFDTIFSVIQQRRNLKPNPYLSDTARYLITIAAGEAVSYAPACNNDSLPLDIIQKAYIESYGLKKYTPTIMQPAHFDIETHNKPVYYSMQNPSTAIFSPKSRQISSTLFEMRELAYIMKIFVEELTKTNSFCADTTLFKVLQKVQFNYFHNEKDSHHIIKPSTEIAEIDNRFLFSNYHDSIPDAKFASDAKFLRGCISIQEK